MNTSLFGFTRRRTLALAAACVAGLSLGMAAQAQSIAAIKKSGVLNVGVQAEFPPWGSIDANGQNIGYDVDVARLMADDLGVKLQLTAVTAANRIAYLTTEKVDVLAAAIGMYPERAKAVQFSKPYATLDGVIYGKKSDTIKTWSDLAKLTVGAARGSAADAALTRELPPGTTYRRFEDDAAPIAALMSGQVDAIGSTNLIAVVLAKSPAGAQYEQKFAFTRQYNGLASRLGQAEFNAWLNAFIDRNMANGKLDAINQKWIGGKLPALPAEIPGVPFVSP
jgi:polar amino acid transport system substrate-binding protein